MTLFDYAVLTVIGLSIIVSVVRGFAREALSLLGWVIAFFAANALSGIAAEWLTPLIKDGAVRVFAAFVTIFIVTLILMSLFAMAMSRMLKGAGLGLEDRLIGGFFGFARGMLIVLIMVMAAGFTALPRHHTWTEAMLSPPLEALAGAFKPWLPEAVSRYLSYD
jgi:membrane protein required for colicin V production